MTALDDAGARTPATAVAAVAAGRWRRRGVAPFVGIGLLLGLLRSELPPEPDALWSIRAGLVVLGMLVLLVAPRAQTVSTLIAFALPPLMGPILLRPGRRWLVPWPGWPHCSASG